MSSQSPIIVIGASAGGFEALKTLIGGLSPDFATPIFIVWHVSADSPGVLPEVLNRYRNGSAAHARDREPIEEGRIYIALPDKHLLVENSHVRVSRGAKGESFPSCGRSSVQVGRLSLWPECYRYRTFRSA